MESSLSLSEPSIVSEKLPEQQRGPEHRLHNDIGNTHHGVVANLMAGRLPSKHKTSAKSLFVAMNCFVTLLLIVMLF